MLFRDRPLLEQKIQHRTAKTALEQCFRNRRQFEERSVRPKNPVGGEYVHVRMKVHQIAEGLQLDERGPRTRHRGAARQALWRTRAAIR